MKHVKHYLLLIIIVLLGGFLRFYKLDWGSGYFFHPDEYHIAAAVNHLSFPHQMNPELFSYGSFTVYLIYFTKLFLSFIPSYLLSPISYLLSPILIGRFYSALFSTLTIILVYFIFHHLLTTHNPTHNPQPTTHYSLLAAALCAAMPGLIQQAHFATPESILTFWLFLTLLMSLKKHFYLAAASQGLALGTKITAITFLPIVLLPLVLNSPSEEVDDATTSEVARQRPPCPQCKHSFGRRGLLRGESWRQVILSTLIILFFFFLSFPYAFLDWQSFRSSLNYETGVARGQPVVFYTRQFTNTTPILFQFEKVLPCALGPGALILGSLGFLRILGDLRKRKYYILHTTYYILLLAFLCYFFPNGFLFAKWTRFMAPILPFFAIFTGYFLSLIEKKRLLRVACCVFLVANLVWTIMFLSIYLKPDVRITTTDWLNNNLPANSFILTESGNMLEVPLEGNLKKTAFDFYHFEENSQLQDELPELLSQADYFIVQSRRIFLNHQRLPKQFPRTTRFYDLLFTEQLGFEKIKEFSSFPTLKVRNFELKINDEMAEETWSVFDHPVIRVYEKTKILTTEDYEKLLQI